MTAVAIYRGVRRRERRWRLSGSQPMRPGGADPGAGSLGGDGQRGHALVAGRRCRRGGARARATARSERASRRTARAVRRPGADVARPRRAPRRLRRRLCPPARLAAHQPRRPRRGRLGARRPSPARAGPRGAAIGASAPRRRFRRQASSPVLVPPWNRISARVTERLPALGFVGLSTFGPRARRRTGARPPAGQRPLRPGQVEAGRPVRRHRAGARRSASAISRRGAPAPSIRSSRPGL